MIASLNELTALVGRLRDIADRQHLLLMRCQSLMALCHEIDFDNPMMTANLRTLCKSVERDISAHLTDSKNAL